jgi:hypothetical protein
MEKRLKSTGAPPQGEHKSGSRLSRFPQGFLSFFEIFVWEKMSNRALAVNPLPVEVDSGKYGYANGQRFIQALSRHADFTAKRCGLLRDREAAR